MVRVLRNPQNNFTGDVSPDARHFRVLSNLLIAMVSLNVLCTLVCWRASSADFVFAAAVIAASAKLQRLATGDAFFGARKVKDILRKKSQIAFVGGTVYEPRVKLLGWYDVLKSRGLVLCILMFLVQQFVFFTFASMLSPQSGTRVLIYFLTLALFVCAQPMLLWVPLVLSSICLAASAGPLGQFVGVAAAVLFLVQCLVFAFMQHAYRESIQFFDDWERHLSRLFRKKPWAFGLKVILIAAIGGLLIPKPKPRNSRQHQLSNAAHNNLWLKGSGPSGPSSGSTGPGSGVGSARSGPTSPRAGQREQRYSDDGGERQDRASSEAINIEGSQFSDGGTEGQTSVGPEPSPGSQRPETTDEGVGTSGGEGAGYGQANENGGTGGTAGEAEGSNVGAKDAGGGVKNPKKSSFTKLRPDLFRIPDLNLKNLNVKKLIGILLSLTILFLIVERFGRKKVQPEELAPKADKKRQSLLNKHTANELHRRLYELTGIPTGLDPRTLIVETYQTLLKFYETCGAARFSHETPDEYRLRHHQLNPQSAGPWATVTSTFVDVFYGKKQIDEPLLQQYLNAVSQLMKR